MFKRSVLLFALAGNIWGMSWGDGVKGNGIPGSQELTLNTFHHLTVHQSLNVIVHCGAETRGILQGDANLLAMVKVNQDGDHLTLGLENDIHGRHDLVVELWTQSLKSVEATGATSVEVEDLNAPVFHVNASGASDVKLSGEVGEFFCEVSGASDLKARSCPARVVSSDLSGASDARVTVLERLSGECSGASDLQYWGHPKQVHVETSGASSAKSHTRKESVGDAL